MKAREAFNNKVMLEKREILLQLEKLHQDIEEAVVPCNKVVYQISQIHRRLTSLTVLVSQSYLQINEK